MQTGPKLAIGVFAIITLLENFCIHAAPPERKEYIIVFQPHGRLVKDEILNKVRAGKIPGVKMEQCDTSTDGPVDPKKCLGNINFKNFKGLTVSANEKAIEGIKRNPNVKYVEEVKPVELFSCKSQSGPTWGIDHVDYNLYSGTWGAGAQNAPYKDGTYFYDDAGGNNVRVYVVDTGIYTSHPDFGGRALPGVSTVGGSSSDGHGHGTHVAGTIVSNTYGIARGTNARVIAVKVISDSGYGTSASFVAGLNWVKQDMQQNGDGKRAVINMSLGGGADQAMDDAVNALVSENMVVVVAAGNSNKDACNASPARATDAITVGCHDMNKARCSFSNWGACVDIFAPGKDIASLRNANSGTVVMSGTSMSSPHVAGVAAVFLTYSPCASPSEILSSLRWMAPDCKVTDAKGSANEILQLYCAVPYLTCPRPSVFSYAKAACARK